MSRGSCGRKPIVGSVGRRGLNQLPSDLGSSQPLPPNSRAGFAENGGKANPKRINLLPDNIQTLSLDSSSMDLSMSDPTAWTTAMNNLGMAPMGMTADPPLPNFDPALGMMTGIPPLNPLMPGLGIVPPPILSDMPMAKEIVHCKSCTLFPPNPNLPPPTTRERPPGCKTVFVGGLPENGTEETIVEIFEKCGEIVALRKSKKHFCHIRFAEEYMVDKAVYLSGYRIRLGSSTDKKDTGRLHVDFAEARDDLYEWECKQRMLAREERHRKRKTEERFLPPSPPPVVNYSDYECSLVVEKLKVDAKFLEAIQTLLAWLERGEVNRRTANSFYTMVQSVNSHIRRLMNEKAAQDKEMEEAKEKFKLALSGILAQFEQIVAVYHSACKQKAWDHFTKAQRKNISVWCKQAEELRNLHNDELMDIRREEAMEMSDDDEEAESPEIKETEESVLVSQTEALKEENNSLRCQLDAYRNEVELLKQEQGRAGREDESSKDQQLKILQQTLQGMQQHLQKLQEDCERREAELEKAKEEKIQLDQLLERLKKEKQDLAAGSDREKDSMEAKDQDSGLSNICSKSPEKERLLEKGLHCHPLRLERDALLVGIISTFLHVHPFGASIEYICSYLQRLDSKICATEVENLMTGLQHTFKQEMNGVGASLEKRWKFCGFEGLKTIT
ncbi:ecto-NOX disulfide-thiol exchanger 2 isoform X1 [Pseudonaja textilis]|uniref:ecto-NOX disulfide-thiol exchanger 2 isoform X1 n=1 Tax=Pseudonaja textilis TaxID=8673 RepID=UPI000EA96CFD|nr:ecto-NOX disulfide-thiol exchanger 2 isoform X1 [Pseudonaja textilis]